MIRSLLWTFIVAAGGSFPLFAQGPAPPSSPETAAPSQPEPTPTVPGPTAPTQSAPGPLRPAPSVPAAVQPSEPATAVDRAPPEPATLRLWNRDVAVFRSNIRSAAPRDRVEAALLRFETQVDPDAASKVSAEFTRVGELEGYLVMVDGAILFALLRDDMDPLSRETYEEFVQNTVQRLEAVLQARAEQRSLPVLLRGLALSTAAALGVVLCCVVVVWRRRRFRARLESGAGRLAHMRFMEIDAYPLLLAGLRRLVDLIAWGVVLTAVYLGLTYSLSQFPYTRPWGETLGRYMTHTAGRIVWALLEALPGLTTVALIFLLARLFQRTLTSLLRGVESGRVKLTWLEPESARATRRLSSAVLWLFAASVAYPFIPGSSTEAFKGLSVLIGLMISIGSSGVVNQITSGLLVLYARAVRTGDYVKIGEVEGTITELGMLSVKVVNRRQEEITIPNAVLLGTSTTNYSRLTDQEGSVVTTTVTIGYDTPWRQVHALLLLAAERTSGVLRSPAPRVLQTALSDFYIEYVLMFRVSRPQDRWPILSELHGQIQDAFNQFGVQIMSPHFETQPSAPVLSPPSTWHSAPASPGPNSPSPASAGPGPGSASPASPSPVSPAAASPASDPSPVHAV